MTTIKVKTVGPAVLAPRGAAVAETDTSVARARTTHITEAMLARYVWCATRFGLAFVFLWAFFDKTFGWGRATKSSAAWINGGSPTTGFLKGVDGTLADQFQWLAGRTWVDWLFMIGLLGIGVALALGIGMRIAAGTGALLLVFMWAASLPITTNPFLHDHLIYALVLVGLALVHAGDTIGLGRWWSHTRAVRRFPVLR